MHATTFWSLPFQRWRLETKILRKHPPKKSPTSKMVNAHNHPTSERKDWNKTPNRVSLTLKEWDWCHCDSLAVEKRPAFVSSASDSKAPVIHTRAISEVTTPNRLLHPSPNERTSDVFACEELQLASPTTGMPKLWQGSAYFSTLAVNCGGWGLWAAVQGVTSSATSNQGALRHSLAMMKSPSPQHHAHSSLGIECFGGEVMQE